MKFSVLAKWFNAVGDAWNRGEAPWAYNKQGHSAIVRMWSYVNARDGEDAADRAVVQYAQQMGISLKRHKPT